MKNYNFILILFVSIVFYACEKTSIVEIDLEDNEFIVIRSEVKSEENFEGVSITRTLPVGIKYDIKLAEIKDAYAYIRVNGIQVIPLHYTFDGIYKTKYDYKIKAGDTFELFGKANQKEFYSKTKAPHKPVVVSVNYNPNQYYEARIQPVEGEVFGAIWIVDDQQAEDYFAIEKSKPGSPFDLISLRTKTLPQQFHNSSYNGKRFMKVYSFDNAYLDYFQTKGENLPVDNSFVQSPGYINWNVQGENIIGLFIGIAEGEIYPKR